MLPDRRQEDDIRLIPCSRCGGQPVVMIRPGWPHPSLRVICSDCGQAGPQIYYAPEGPTWYLGIDRVLLPGLARARREAAACWNQEGGS